jgi:hypothetical protein
MRSVDKHDGVRKTARYTSFVSHLKRNIAEAANTISFVSREMFRTKHAESGIRDAGMIISS